MLQKQSLTVVLLQDCAESKFDPLHSQRNYAQRDFSLWSNLPYMEEQIGWHHVEAECSKTFKLVKSLSRKYFQFWIKSKLDWKALKKLKADKLIHICSPQEILNNSRLIKSPNIPWLTVKNTYFFPDPHLTYLQN